jgi:hypothetical protein
VPSPMPETQEADRNEEQWQKQDMAAADDEHDDPDRKTDRKQSPHSAVPGAGEETAPTGLEQREHRGYMVRQLPRSSPSVTNTVRALPLR